MDSPKLVKHSKTVKFPRVSGSVAAALERASSMAKEQKWTQVIIMGCGKTQGHYFHNRAQIDKLVGMAENTIHLMQQDFMG